MPAAINTCLLYGGVNSWLSWNLLVLLISFLGIAVIYMFSRASPARTKASLTALARVEVTQGILSALILFIVLATTNAACSLATQTGANLAATPNAPVTLGAIRCPTNEIGITPADPFTYAENYMGALALGVGPNIATQIYTDSYNLAIQAANWPAVSELLSSVLESYGIDHTFQAGPVGITVGFLFGLDFSAPYAILGDVYLDAFIPIVLIGVTLTFIQYLVLLIIQQTAFVIILPAALLLRSFAFLGGGMRTTSNSLLAIAIASYLVYPMMVGFDHYAISWLYTQCSYPPVAGQACNPSAAYLCGTYQYQDYSSAVLASVPTPAPWTFSLPFGAGTLSLPLNQLLSVIQNGLISASNTLLSLVGSGGPGLVQQVQTIVSEVSEYMFESVFMMALNLSVAFGFAMGLARALNSGVEGTASFWSNL